jgi:L-asparagine transporter-like permease
MNAADYLINAALVLLALRQIREMRLSWQILVLPVLIVIGAAAYYLRSVPLAGNDVVLYLALGAVGTLIDLIALARLPRSQTRARPFSGPLQLAGSTKAARALKASWVLPRRCAMSCAPSPAQTRNVYCSV